MARKHDKLFKYGGYRYAPEQWGFSYNGKQINLDTDTKTTLAMLVISGKRKEAEDELKRLLRKEEKQINDFVTFGFFGKNSNKYYFTSQLSAHRNNLAEKLRIYKEWKRYIIEDKNGKLQPFVVTSGYFTPYGTEEKREEDTSIVIDFKRHGCTIRFIKEKIFT